MTTITVKLMILLLDYRTKDLSPNKISISLELQNNMLLILLVF
jgi:hypothetical protein